MLGRLAVSKSKLPNHVASCTFTEFSHLGHCRSTAKGSKVFWGSQCNSCDGGCSAKNAPLLSGRTRLGNWTLEKISFCSFGTELSMWYVLIRKRMEDSTRLRLGRLFFLSKRVCTLSSRVWPSGKDKMKLNLQTLCTCALREASGRVWPSYLHSRCDQIFWMG